ncbi:hypothetical protein DENSPDRAFT_56547 [Dentipellis sp. KUC8613]|nr:hypothetical protein DENSPDRAFT_56547 [Dentipellis sp. KUC8613]
MGRRKQNMGYGIQDSGFGKYPCWRSVVSGHDATPNPNPNVNSAPTSNARPFTHLPIQSFIHFRLPAARAYAHVYSHLASYLYCPSHLHRHLHLHLHLHLPSASCAPPASCLLAPMVMVVAVVVANRNGSAFPRMCIFAAGSTARRRHLINQSVLSVQRPAHCPVSLVSDDPPNPNPTVAAHPDGKYLAQASCSQRWRQLCSICVSQSGTIAACPLCAVVICPILRPPTRARLPVAGCRYVRLSSLLSVLGLGLGLRSWITVDSY